MFYDKNCTKLLKGSFYINYLVILINLLDDFVAYNIIILEPNFWLLSYYTKMHPW
jgi:hypothetical protein